MNNFLALSFLLLTLYAPPVYSTQSIQLVDEGMAPTSNAIALESGNSNQLTNPFEMLPRDVGTYMMKFLEEQYFSRVSITSKRFRLYAMGASKLSLQRNHNSSWILPFITSDEKTQPNYIVALYLHKYIDVTWKVLRGSIETQQKLEESWLKWITTKLSSMQTTGHPLKDVTLKILRSYQGEQVAIITPPLESSVEQAKRLEHRATSAELLSLFHMMEFPEAKPKSKALQFFNFFFNRRGQTQVQSPQGIQEAKKYAIEAAKLDRPQALESLLLTQFDFMGLPVMNDEFFNASIDGQANQFYSDRQQKQLTGKLIAIIKNDNLEKFSTAFDLAIELSEFKGDERLRQLALYYHYCAVTFIVKQRTDLLIRFILKPLALIVDQDSPSVLKILVRKLKSEIDSKGLQIDAETEALINKSWNEL